LILLIQGISGAVLSTGTDDSGANSNRADDRPRDSTPLTELSPSVRQQPLAPPTDPVREPVLPHAIEQGAPGRAEQLGGLGNVSARTAQRIHDDISFQLDSHVADSTAPEYENQIVCRKTKRLIPYKHIRDALKEKRGNIKRAADQLDMSEKIMHAALNRFVELKEVARDLRLETSKTGHGRPTDAALALLSDTDKLPEL
jgi:hypothetical protein